jgi:hypothetical protein
MAKTINKDIDIYADKTGGYAAITRSLVDCELLTTKDGDYFIDRSFTAREEWIAETVKSPSIKALSFSMRGQTNKPPARSPNLSVIILKMAGCQRSLRK